MEIASTLINTVADILGWIYVIILLKNLYEKLNGIIPNISWIKCRMHIACGLILLKGFSLVIGQGVWISWIIWICIFILCIIEYENTK